MASSLSCGVFAWNGVAMAPGATVFTRMFFFARSRAVWRVRLCTAALAEAYTLAPAPPPSMPAIEPTLMMLPPPRFSKCGMAACVAASSERTLRS